MDTECGKGADLSIIRTIAETGSTNADLLTLAASGAAEEGMWLRAERQTSGRGRQGRVWQSPPGNLYASTLVRLRPTDPAAPTLALVAAVALIEAARALRPEGDARLHLKWPNDLMVGDAKLAGILLERSGQAVVIGVGVNLAHSPDLPDRRTVSLSVLGHAPSPEIFAEVLAECFARWLARWRGEGLGCVTAAWTASAHPPGTAISARRSDGDVTEGLFDGLAHDGALILRLADGTREIIHAGEVFVL